MNTLSNLEEVVRRASSTGKITPLTIRLAVQSLREGSAFLKETPNQYQKDSQYGQSSQQSHPYRPLPSRR